MGRIVMRGVVGLCVVAVVFLGVVASCAPKTQRPLAPPADFSGPRFTQDAFISFDGARLGLTVWAAENETQNPDAVIIAVHGMSEYADAFWLAGPWWASQGVRVYAYDQRGFGRSPERGVWPGGDLMRRDLRAAVAAARAAHPDAVVAVVGQSMGGAVTLTADDAGDAPLADRVIVTAPAVRGWSVLPWTHKVSLWFASRVTGGWAVQPPRRVAVAVQATDNLEALYRNGNDPLFLHQTRFDALAGLVDLMEEASRAVPGQHTPTLVVYGAKDELIPLDAAQYALQTVGPCTRTAFYPDGWHMVLRDLQAETVWRDIVAFIRDPAGPTPSGVGPIPDVAASSGESETSFSSCPV